MSKQHMTKSYEQLFATFLEVKSSVQSIAGFVQNDIDSLVEDGHASKEDIQTAIDELTEQAKKVQTMFVQNVNDSIERLKLTLNNNFND